MTIPALPDAPALGDSPEVFNTKAFAFVAALDDWGTAANAVAAAVDADATAADADAATATTQAGIATAGANTATTQAGIATTKAGEAATSANLADASADAANLSAIAADASADAAAASADSIDPASLLTKAGNLSGIANAVTAANNIGLNPYGNGFKNRIINGAMMIDQRNAGASVTPVNGEYQLDRWTYQASQASKVTLQQNAGSVTPPAGFSKYLGITSSSAYTVGASEWFVLIQKLEGFNFADFDFGTANAQAVTVSFLVYSSLTGTFGASFANEAGTRSYPFSYTISSANTWTKITQTIAGDTSGTWVGATNASAARLYFSLGTGSTYSGTSGAWASANYRSATGATSVVGTSGATFYITGVQLEKGSTATSFDYRPYGTELALCQRYYYKTFPQATAPAQNTGVYAGAIYYIAVLGGANYMGVSVYFPVTMRATPTTLTFYNPGAANAKWRNTSTNADSGNTTPPNNLSQYGFVAINNPQVAGDNVNNSIFIHATAEAEL